MSKALVLGGAALMAGGTYILGREHGGLSVANQLGIPKCGTLPPAERAKRQEISAMKGMGFPLYVNGKRFAEPVTISHVPGPGDAQGILGGMGVDPSMGGLGAYAAYNITKGVLGADTPAPAPLNPEAQPGQPAAPPTPGMQADGMGLLWGLVSVASAAGLVYHGYRRNHSIGWAIGWAILGGLAPIIAWPVAFAQGYGKPKSMTPNRRRRRSSRRRRRSR